MELLERAGRDDLDGVERLIQEGVDVNTTNSSNQTALYCACEKGHAELAECLLDNGASVDLGEKPLIVAVRNGHDYCVKLLLEHNADANCSNTEGESLMSVATQQRNYSIILLLLQYGVTPSASLDDIAIPLLENVKLIPWLEHAKIIEKLICDEVINLTSWEIFLAYFSFAFKRGSVELAHRMLETNVSSYSTAKQLYSHAAYFSAKNNWSTVLLELIQKNADINSLTHGQTPLYVACKEQHESVVNLLLNNGANPNVPNTRRASPLQIAVQHGNVVIANMLIGKGANVNQHDVPLLNIACSSAIEWKYAGKVVGTGSVERMLSIIRLLLQQGVDVNAMSASGDTALYRACVSDQLKFVQILLEAGADVNLTSNRHYPLIAACNAGNVQLINLLVKAGADVKFRNANGKTCLHAIIDTYASRTGLQKHSDSDNVSQLDIVNTIKLLLDRGVDINAYFDELTALYCVSKAGKEEIVRLLLEAGAEANSSTSRNPLHAACERGYTQIAVLLLQYGADSNASSTLVPRPILCALMRGYYDIVYLLLKHGADVNKEDQYGKSALVYFVHSLAVQRRTTPRTSNTPDEGSLDMLKAMLLAGGDVNKLSQYDGCNALHIASSFGMCDVMMELIQHGANCNCLSASGKTALDLACEKGHEAAMELLLKNGAKPDRGTATTHSVGGIHLSLLKPVLCTTTMNGSAAMVKLLLNHGADVNASDEDGNTALHLTTSSAIIEMLLNAGADANAANHNGETALSVTCKDRYDSYPHDNERFGQRPTEKRQTDAKVIEMLLKFGADPNTCSPMHVACKNNDLETVGMLLTYGADANLMKSTGDGLNPVTDIEPSPLCIACKNGNRAIVDCLLANGAATSFADNDGNTPLHFAIGRLVEKASPEDYEPIVTLLLQHNAAVNVVSNSGESPLYAACSRGLTGVVKQLLDCNADVDLTTGNSNKYLLIIACEKNFSDIAMMLLDRGADANVCEDEKTPLKLASAHGNAVLVKHLLVCGADVNKRQNNSDTALHAAVVGFKSLANTHSYSSGTVFHKIVKRLLKIGAEANAVNNRGETPLYLMCRPTINTMSIADGILRILLEHGADPNLCPPHDSSCSMSLSQVCSPLSAAVIRGSTELVMLLIKFGARLDQTDQLGRTAVHYAVEQLSVTDTEILKILLSAGADGDVMDKLGTTPLYLACDRGMTEFIKLLTSYSASRNAQFSYMNLLHAACRGQHYDSVKLLLELEYDADVNASDANGKTALHHAVEACPTDKGIDLVQLLFDKGADMNTTSNDGNTPLSVACSHGLASVGLVAKMLKCGAKVNGNVGAKVPLIAACGNNHLSVGQLLLMNGADPNRPVPKEDNYPTLPLHIAANHCNRKLVKLLLKHGADIDVRDIHGNTALHYAIKPSYRNVLSARNAAANDAKSVIDTLLKNKADVNVENTSGETPLSLAAFRQWPDVVDKMLRKYGGNPNKGSPLAVACCSIGTVEVVETLLKHGANPCMASTICDTYQEGPEQQRLPLFIAVEGGNSGIITLLLNAGASVNMENHRGQNIACFAAERLTSSGYFFLSTQKTRNKISAVHLLLQHGANFNMLLPDGHSPLYLVVSAMRKCGNFSRLESLVELLQLMVKHGAMLKDSVCLDCDMCHQSLHSGTLITLAKFVHRQHKHKFVVDMLRAGVGFQVITFCCDALARHHPEAIRSIRLCQAVVLAGYSPSDEELQNLQVAAADETEAGGLLKQLLKWLNEDRRAAPSLLRQCRIAIRRQLSEAVHHRTIIPAVDELDLPPDLKQYLQFAEVIPEVDLSVGLNKDLQTCRPKSIEEAFMEDYHSLRNLHVHMFSC